MPDVITDNYCNINNLNDHKLLHLLCTSKCTKWYKRQTRFLRSFPNDLRTHMSLTPSCISCLLWQQQQYRNIQNVSETMNAAAILMAVLEDKTEDKNKCNVLHSNQNEIGVFFPWLYNVKYNTRWLVESNKRRIITIIENILKGLSGSVYVAPTL